MFSSLEIFKNPVTGEFASLFTHNINCVIVTDNITINSNVNTAYKTLTLLGFTEDTKQSAAVRD